MTYALIAMFVYNRLDHTQRTIDALKRNELADKSTLHIFSDGPRSEKDMENVDSVRNYIRKINGFKNIQIYESKKNLGIVKSLIGGITQTLSHQESVIVVEDDLVSSPYFLSYMNHSLQKYKDKKNIFSICGFNYPESFLKIPNLYPYSAYFSYRFFSWGWGTWKDRWEKTDWEVSDYEEIKQNFRKRKAFNRGGHDRSDRLIKDMETNEGGWEIRFQYAHFKHNAYTLCPVISYIDHIGWDGSGVHCGITDKYKNDLSKCKFPVTYPPEIRVDKKIYKNLHNALYQSFSHKLKRILIFYLKYLRVYPVSRIIIHQIRQLIR